MSVINGLAPPISWAQTNDVIYIIIDVECSDIEHKVTENTFSFKGVNVLDPSKKYDVTLSLNQEIDTEKVKSKNIARCVEFTIHKKTPGPFWPALTSDKARLHFVKPNFAKWEDESEDEANNMMGDMNNLDYPSNFDNSYMRNFDDLEVFDDEEDSDDNIPSLAQVSDEEGDEAEKKKEEKDKQ